jgi:hypothetical protein
MANNIEHEKGFKKTETWRIIPKDQLIYATKPAKHSKIATPLSILFTSKN